MITVRFGQRIKLLRNEKGLSQEKFALSIEMDRTYYASVESGKRNISLNNIEKIPNISINELADLCYTSPATISRFCKALKCDNFAEFKKEVESGLRQANHEIKLSSQDLGEIHNEPSKCVDMVYDLSIN